MHSLNLDLRPNSSLTSSPNCFLCAQTDWKEKIKKRFNAEHANRFGDLLPKVALDYGAYAELNVDSLSGSKIDPQVAGLII